MLQMSIDVESHNRLPEGALTSSPRQSSSRYLIDSCQNQGKLFKFLLSLPSEHPWSCSMQQEHALLPYLFRLAAADYEVGACRSQALAEVGDSVNDKLRSVGPCAADAAARLAVLPRVKAVHLHVIRYPLMACSCSPLATHHGIMFRGRKHTQLTCHISGYHCSSWKCGFDSR